MANSKISALTAATTPLAGTEVLPVVQSGVTKQVSVSDLTDGRTVTASKLQLSSSGEILKMTTSGNVTSTGTDYLRFYDSVGARGYVGYAGTAARFDINSGPSCDLYLNAVNGTMTLATGNAARWTLTNAGSFIQQAASTGMNFTANTPAAGMTSQLLNWYEEGTFTPTYTTSNGAFASVTYGFQNGKYVRIGKMVYITLSMRTTAANITGATGLLQVAGLPFTAVTQSLGAASMSVSYASIFSNVRPMGAYVASGGTVMYLTYISNPVGSNWGELNATELSTANPANQLLLTGSYMAA